MRSVLLLICAMSFSFNLFAYDMLFLVEGSEGKQVGMSASKGHFDYLTSGSKWHLYPDIDPSGRWITYVEGEDQNSLKIVTEDRERKVKEIWGSRGGFYLQPRFAKNGELLFFSGLLDGEKNQIAFINLVKYRKTKSPESVIEYEVEMQVIEDEFSSFFPAPFADGQRIVYQRNKAEGQREIVLRDLQDDKIIVLDEGMSPSLSKDERFVAYTKKFHGNWDVYIYDLHRNVAFRATNHVSKDFSPVFDGQNNLIFTSDRLEEGVFSIYTQSFESWQKSYYQEELYLSQKGVSFYAPRLSGEKSFVLENKERMTGEPRSSFGAIEHLGRIYVAGGHQGPEHTYPPESFTNRVTYYDLEKRQWFNAAPRVYRCHGFSLAAYGDYLYAFGGFAYDENNSPKWKSLDVIERYDIKADKWEVIGQMPRRRSSNVVVQLGHKVYLIGGWDSTPRYNGDIDGTFHAEIDVFDMESEEIETSSDQLPLKRRAFSAFTRNGKIYLVGGISEGGSHFSLLDQVTEYDPIIGSFRELPPLPFPTFAPAAGIIGDQMFVFGGMFKTGKYNYEYVSHIYSYSFNAKQWTHSGRYLNENKGFSQVVSWDEKIGILGGHSYDGDRDTPVDTFEVFSVKRK